MMLPHDRDPGLALAALPEVRRQAVTDGLNRLAADALRLRALAHQSGLHVMAMGHGLPGQQGRPADVRRVMRDIEGTLVSIREAEGAVLPRMDPALRTQMAAALSPGALAPFDQLLVHLGQIIARVGADPVSTESGPGPAELARTELFRLISVDLDGAVRSIERTVRIALSTRPSPDVEGGIDPLTGLPDRAAFYRRADGHWHGTGPDMPMTLLWLGVEGLTGPNAEATLRRVASCVRDHLREGDFCTRIGPDAFVLVLCGDHADAIVARRAARLLDQIATPVEEQGDDAALTASIGIVRLRPGDRLGFDRSLYNAELAHGLARVAGSGRYHVHAPGLALRQSLAPLAGEIAEGLSRGEFVPYFQPQVDASSGRLVGLEALARWHHPQRGVLTPYHFLELARRAGLLASMDREITQAAIIALGKWRADGHVVPRLSINIGAQWLSSEGLADTLPGLLLDAGLPSTALALDISESAVFGGAADDLAARLRQLSEAGFAVGLDDFGTGHASLLHLHHLKVCRVLIDRSFSREIHLHPDQGRITGAIIALARSLGIETLAKGVETPEERLALNGLGVDHLQGFGVARPMPFEEVDGWLRRTQCKPALPPPRVTTV